MPRSRTLSLFGLIAVLGAAGCSHSVDEPAAVATEVRVSAVSIDIPDASTAQLSARVYDQRGNAMSTDVQWTNGHPDVATLSGTTVTALHPGTDTLTARAGTAAASVQIVVRPVPSAVTYGAGRADSGRTKRALPDSLQVRVIDRHGDPVPGAAVHFSPRDTGSGRVLPDTVVATDALGRAEAQWVLGSFGGTQRVVAHVATRADSVVYETRGVPSRVTRVLVGGDRQTAIAGDPLADSVGVQVVDQDGGVMAGVPVTWQSVNGGALSPAVGTTDANGWARARWTLRGSAGSDTAVATVASWPDGVSFTATGVAGPPAFVRIVSGDSQTAVVATTLPRKLEAMVTDSNDNRVDAPITWSGDGRADAGVRITGANPSAIALVDPVPSTYWVLDTVAGMRTIRASVSGAVPAVFHATALPDVPAKVRVSLSQAQAIGYEPDTLTATALVLDRYGNAAPGAAVSWSADNGSVGSGNCVTGSDARCSIAWAFDDFDYYLNEAQTVTADIGVQQAQDTLYAVFPAYIGFEYIGGPPNAMQPTFDGVVLRMGVFDGAELRVAVYDSYGNPIPALQLSYDNARVADLSTESGGARLAAAPRRAPMPALGAAGRTGPRPIRAPARLAVPPRASRRGVVAPRLLLLASGGIIRVRGATQGNEPVNITWSDRYQSLSATLNLTITDPMDSVAVAPESVTVAVGDSVLVRAGAYSNGDSLSDDWPGGSRVYSWDASSNAPTELIRIHGDASSPNGQWIVALDTGEATVSASATIDGSQRRFAEVAVAVVSTAAAPGGPRLARPGGARSAFPRAQRQPPARSTPH